MKKKKAFFRWLIEKEKHFIGKETRIDEIYKINLQLKTQKNP